MFKLNEKVWDKSVSNSPAIIIDLGIGIIHDFPIKVEFDNSLQYYTLDGRRSKDFPATLSTAEYTFLGFSQEPTIEKGTLVYVRDLENLSWEMAHYSNFHNKHHWCFKNQEKSGDTETWEICQTKNPLI